MKSARSLHDGLRTGCLMMIAAALLVASLTACGRGVRICDPDTGRKHHISGKFHPFETIPKARVGGLPYPDLFSLLEISNPESIGRHTYGLSIGEEVDRGMIYTRRGGLLDLAHVRKTIDVTAYFHARVHYALSEGYPCLVLRSREPSRFHVYLTPPQDWHALEPAHRQKVIDEAAIIMAQRLAVISLTWHEILTWFGYRSTVLIPEFESSFTHDDSTSHIVGAVVAGDVLRAMSMTDAATGGRVEIDFDDAVTQHLDRWLVQLEAVSPEETRAALDRMEGIWWDGSGAMVRQFDTGLDDPFVPWLIVHDEESAEPAPTPWVLQLSSLEDVHGIDLSHMTRVEIDPRVLESRAIRRMLPGSPRRVVVSDHWDLLMETIAAQWEKQLAR